ncbi:MAG: 2-octaprenyl-6-methoxyphenyl hydroxylase [Gammaproteobacteria bacterium]
MQTDFDCLIVGGGMVGASLACALRDQVLDNKPIKIAVVEAFSPNKNNPPNYDDRGLGIAPASQRILQGLGLWEKLEAEATPIKKIHISDRGHFAATRLSAEKMGVDQLGHIVIGRALGEVLHDTLNHSENIEYICPATVANIEHQSDHISVEIQNQKGTNKVTARLLIAADGGNSQVRKMLDVETEAKQYDQTAIVTNVTPEISHNNTAFERFTSTGPLALLPSSDQRCVVVWTTKTEQADSIMQLEESEFLEQLEKRFGHRLGKFLKMGQRRSYPINLIKAKQLIGPRFAILGNAAHTIHPNAAQGLNLGLRDIAQMAELIVEAARSNKDIGHPELLNAYAESRQKDHQQVIHFSDGLTKIFYNDNPVLITLRNLAMLGVEHFPPAKRALTRRAMGLSGEPPRLVRGLPL